MRKALALRHVAFEDLGRLEEILAARGIQCEIIDAPMAEVSKLDALGPDLLIVLGGPIGVYETEAYPFLAEEIALISARLAARRPILGLCLGAQLMAAALGARVYPGPRKEIGYGPLELTGRGRASPLRALGGDVPVLHWHGDTFELPPSADALARSPLYEQQAFSVGNSALALQFHLEVPPEKLESWLVGHAVELAQAQIDPRSLRADARRHEPSLSAAARDVFTRWLDGLD